MGPLHRHDVVLRHTPAVEVHDAEAILGARVTLFGGQAVPFHRHDVVLRGAPTPSIFATLIRGGYGVSLNSAIKASIEVRSCGTGS